MATKSAVSANASSPYAALGAIDLSEVTSDFKVEGLVRVLAEKYGELNTIIEAEARELFCICQKEDADCGGGMIECSNGDQCKDRWFHFKCIGMVQIPGEKDDWFCNYCVMHRWGGAGQWDDTLQSIRSKPSTFDTVPASDDLDLAMCKTRPNLKSNPVATDPDGMTPRAVSSLTITPHFRSSGIEGRLSPENFDISPQFSRKPWKKSELARLSKEMSHMVANNQTGTVDSWDRVAERLQEYGIFRTGNACKIAWTKYLKDHNKTDKRTKNRAGKKMQAVVNNNRKKLDGTLIAEEKITDKKLKVRAGAKKMQEVDMEDQATEEAVNDGNFSEASTVILQNKEDEPCKLFTAKKRSIIHS